MGTFTLKGSLPFVSTEHNLSYYLNLHLLSCSFFCSNKCFVLITVKINFGLESHWQQQDPEGLSFDRGTAVDSCKVLVRDPCSLPSPLVISAFGDKPSWIPISFLCWSSSLDLSILSLFSFTVCQLPLIRAGDSDTKFLSLFVFKLETQNSVCPSPFVYMEYLREAFI